MVINCFQLILDLEDQKWEALLKYGESDKTLKIWNKADRKLKKLYEWIVK